MLKTFAIIFYCLLPLATVDKATAANIIPFTTISQSPQTKSCPKNLTDLTTLLVRDLPNYSNRVIQRTQDRHQDKGIDTYIIAAGVPELEHLNLPQINYGISNSENIEQIFFTTLERQYIGQKKIERQTFHWLFVTITESGWNLVTMYSRFGHATKNTPTTPPQESSDGIIGQAVNLWLRDCRESSKFH